MSMYRMGIDLGEMLFLVCQIFFYRCKQYMLVHCVNCVLKEYVDEYARFDTLSFHCCIETNTHCRRTDGRQSLELVK